MAPTRNVVRSSIDSLQRNLATGLLQRYLLLWRERAFRFRHLPNVLPNLTCIDVGASYFPHNRWWLFLQSPAISWLAVDPDDSTLNYVDRWPWPCSVKRCPLALAASSGIREFSETNIASGSSLLSLHDTLGDAYRISEAERSYFLPARRRTMGTLAISEFLNDQAITGPFIIKLDTQGTEFELIEACRLWIDDNRILAVETEVSLLFTPPYKEAPRLWDKVGAMESRGFELLLLDVFQKQPLKRHSRSKRIVSEADAVFVLRRDIALTKELEFRILLFAVYLTYRLTDEALLLLRDDADLAEYLSPIIRL